MDNFYDSFSEKFNDDELRTIFFTAKQHADKFLNLPACSEFPPEDAKAMSLSLAVTLEVLRRYENYKKL